MYLLIAKLSPRYFRFLCASLKEGKKKWVTVEMVLSPRKKSYHLPVSEEGHRGQSEEGDCLSLFYYLCLVARLDNIY